MIAAIISAIVDVGKWLADKAITIGLVIYHATRIVGLALFRFGHAVAGVFGKVWDAFTKFYAAVLKPFVEWASRSIVKLHAWLKDTLSPVLKFLNQVRDDILRIYQRWLRPILDTIDVLRQTVRVLELFHVPFAQKLDDALAALERRLLQPIRLALEKVNELANWVNRIVDLNGLFQRLTLIESAWHYTGDMWSTLLKHQPAGVSHEQNAALRQRKVVELDPVALRNAVVDYYTTGGGPFAAEIAVVRAKAKLP